MSTITPRNDSTLTRGVTARERPILFSGPMVRAILDGRKTQTRRVVRVDDTPIGDRGALAGHLQRGIPSSAVNVRFMGAYLKCDAPPGSKTVSSRVPCPYGAPGDRLWVRETWGAADQFYQGHELDEPRTVAYAADKSAICFGDPRKPTPVPSWDIAQWNWECVKWKPSIHMSRWMSRITLEVTEVRAQRLQEIVAGDAAAEGIENKPNIPYDTMAWALWHLESFRELWDSINGKRAPWASNPWVWAVSFKRVR